MITASQMRAARAMLGIDQPALADLSGLSLMTIQRMEACTDQVRGTVVTLSKVVDAIENCGIEFIDEYRPTIGIGRGVRLRDLTTQINACSSAVSSPGDAHEHAA